jgi:hypothetical protein
VVGAFADTVAKLSLVGIAILRWILIGYASIVGIDARAAVTVGAATGRCPNVKLPIARSRRPAETRCLRTWRARSTFDILDH